MLKTLRRNESVRRNDGLLQTEKTDVTGVDEINDDSEAAKLRRMSGLIDTNGFTIQGANRTNSPENIEKEEKKAEQYRRALAAAFEDLMPAGFFAALTKAAASASLASSFTGNATTEAPVESIKTEEILVSEEAYEVLHKETQDIEDYIAEYKAETDPEKRARMEMEIKDLAGYYKIKVDFDQKDGPQMFGHDYDHVLKLEEYFHGDNIPTAAECKNKVCVFHVLRHGHTGGLNNKTAPETAKPDDVDGIVGNDKQAVAVVTTPAAPPPPALHLH